MTKRADEVTKNFLSDMAQMQRYELAVDGISIPAVPEIIAKKEDPHFKCENCGWESWYYTQRDCLVCGWRKPQKLGG